MKTDAEIRDQLAALQAQFANDLQKRLARFSERWRQVQPDALTQAALGDLRMEAHALAGSGGTFGFPRLSESMRSIERTLDELLAGSRGTHLFERVGDLLATAGMLDDTPASPEVPAVAPVNLHVAVLPGSVPTLARAITRHLTEFGYQAQTLDHLDDIDQGPGRDQPALLVIEVPPTAGAQSRVEAVGRWLREHNCNVPVVFLSHTDNFALRLEAVRAGGCAFITAPFERSMILRHVDNLLGTVTSEPFRILIVDDDAVLSAHFRLVLEAAGMSVRTASQGATVLQTIDDFSPELILMDLYMPACTGQELASVIRQDDRHASIPIVFLSAETNLERQFGALQIGGDDFIVKPVEDEFLVSSTRVRVRRARQMAALMERDSLTGLLRHSGIKDALAQEVSRCGRRNSQMAFVMLDLDHFKNVNDTWGHHAGDQVLTALARLLGERLRRVDTAGRWGGEEFAVVLPECSVADAEIMIDDLRARFAAITFGEPGSTFQATFSAGISGCPDYDDADALVQAADRSLYEAKHLGRNRVSRSYSAERARTG